MSSIRAGKRGIFDGAIYANQWGIDFLGLAMSDGTGSFSRLRYVRAGTLFNLEFYFPPNPTSDKYCPIPYMRKGLYKGNILPHIP